MDMLYKEQLLRDGIVEILCEDFSDESLLTLASSFGKVVPGARGEMVQPLPAREKGNGPKGSFSYVVGYEQFPWHTDTAYWDVPARFLLLASEEANPCATTYQSFGEIKNSIADFDYLMARAVYLMDVPGEKRYISPRFDILGKCGYRLDFHIYRPVNEEAETLMRLVEKILEKNYLRHLWTGKNVVVMDNWRMIHGREAVSEDKNRLLKRIYINELV